MVDMRLLHQTGIKKPQRIFSKHMKALELMPLERFVTTYSHDFKPCSERQLQVNQLKPRTEAAPAFINPPQTRHETWPVFHQYFYKTTNSIYGSSNCSQLPSCSLSPRFLCPFGTLAPSMSKASGVVGSSLAEAWTQEVGVARDIGPLVDEEEKENVLEQQEAKDEPQQKTDVLYEEGVIMFSSHVGPACCEDFLRCVCREAGLLHQLNRPVVSSPFITIKEAENWDNSACLRGFCVAMGQKNSTFLQPTSRQCSCCAWETVCPNSCCCKMQTFPPCIPCSSTSPLAHVQTTLYCTEPSRKPPMTEYQARYTAEWAQPKMQQSDIHRRHPPRYQILNPSF